MTLLHLLLLVLLLPLIVFIHELGHVIMGWLCGFLITSFGFGFGRPLWVWNWRGTRIYYCFGWRPMGLTFTFPGHPHLSRWQYVGMLLGGILAETCLLILFLVLWNVLSWGQAFWPKAAFVVAFGILCSLVPSPFKVGKETFFNDGALILHLLRHGPASFGLAASPENQERRDFLRLIGDTIQLRVALLAEAYRVVLLGDREQAEILCIQAESMAAGHPLIVNAHCTTLRGQIALRAENYAVSASAFEEAEKSYQSLDDEDNLLYVLFARAELLIYQADVPGANAILDALECHPSIANNPDWKGTMIAARILAAVRTGEVVDHLADAYEATMQEGPSPFNDLQLFPELAQFYARRENWPRAEAAHRNALAAAQKIHESIADPALQTCFRKSQEKLLAEVKNCLQRLGKTQEAEKLDELFALTAVEMKAQQSAEEKERRERRYLRAGLILHAVNFLCILGTAGFIYARQDLIWPHVSSSFPSLWGSFLIESGKYLGFWWGFCVFWLVPSECLSLIYGLLLCTLGQWWTSLGKEKGINCFLLSLSPWLIWAFFAILVLLVILWEDFK